jgi:hypothetical protein
MPSKGYSHTKEAVEMLTPKELCLIKEGMGWMGGKHRNVE